MLTAFLTGIANVYVDYNVTRTLAYGFKFDTKTLTEIMEGLFQWVPNFIGGIFG